MKRINAIEHCVKTEDGFLFTVDMMGRVSDGDMEWPNLAAFHADTGTDVIRALITVTSERFGRQTFLAVACGSHFNYSPASFYSDDVPRCLAAIGMHEMLSFWLVDGNAETGDVCEWLYTENGIEWADSAEGETIEDRLAVRFDVVECYDD